MKKNNLFSITMLLLAMAVNVNAQWSQLGLDIDGKAAFDYSGYSVSTSSDGLKVAIGAYGSGKVRVYEFNGSVWIQMGNDIVGEQSFDRFGWSVSMSANGSTVAIGAYLNTGNGVNAGHVRVYSYNGSNWIQMGSDIDAEAANDYSGFSTSISSDGLTLAIGAKGNGGTASYAGHVRVYSYNGSNWIQMGSDIDGEAKNDESGYSVSLSSDGLTLAIGAPYNDGNGKANSGHVRVYKFNGSSWIKVGNDIDGEATNDESGYSVSISSDGLTVAIGAPYNNGSWTDSGHVRIYKFNGLNWIHQGGDINGEWPNDYFGSSVDLSSDGLTVAIGAYGNAPSFGDMGHVRIYKNLIQQGNDIDGEAANDYSGYSVSLSSDGLTVAIGAYGNDEGGTDAGHTRVYNWSSITSAEMEEIDALNSVKVYPNPSDKFTIELEYFSQALPYEVTDVFGRVIIAGNLNEKLTSLDLSGFDAGVYMLRADDKVVRLIKQ